MSYASSLGPRLSSQSAVRDSNYEISLPKSPSSPVFSLVLVRNQFSILNETGDCVPAVCHVSSSARTGSHLVPPVQARQSPERGRSNRAANIRDHSSSDSVDLLNVPPSKISIGPSSRVRTADGASSTSAVDSVRSLERSSSLNRVVADIHAAAGMDVSQDTPLVEGALPRQLGRSASQDSVTSVSRDRPPVSSISPGHSGSGGAECVGSMGTPDKVDSHSKAPTLQSDSSPRIPVTPLAGASGLSNTRRITVPSQVGKVKGKGRSLTGIRSPRNFNSFPDPPMKL